MTKNVFFACFGLALGAFMGYQLHEQTTPAAIVSAQTFQNENRITHIETRLDNLDLELWVWTKDGLYKLKGFHVKSKP